nr:hypothetical protein [Pseudofrankia sp. DC12]
MADTLRGDEAGGAALADSAVTAARDVRVVIGRLRRRLREVADGTTGGELSPSQASVEPPVCGARRPGPAHGRAGAPSRPAGGAAPVARRAYSTVTDLARLRGRSTSWPSVTAAW